jgi:hypothetical protein
MTRSHDAFTGASRNGGRTTGATADLVFGAQAFRPKPTAAMLPAVMNVRLFMKFVRPIVGGLSPDLFGSFVLTNAYNL